MTEDEAKNKWCHVATSDGDARCFGSDCMAWRWLDSLIERQTGFETGFIPEGDGWVCTLHERGRETFQIKSAWERHLGKRRRGYCGLAGNPEVTK